MTKKTTDALKKAIGHGAAMTKGDRESLEKVIRLRAKVARAEVEERAAELESDVEQKLAAKYEASAASWADITAVARAAVTVADNEIAARCRALGIPENFRPGLSIGWSQRGETASQNRRAELRRVASTQIDALARRALTAIERETVELLTVLVASSLTSEEAKAALAALPTAAQLMPPLALEEFDSWTTPGQHGGVPALREYGVAAAALTAGDDV